jgi:hypothetical protein
VITTGSFPADPTTGQRAELNGVPYYYPDENPPIGIEYHLIQRSTSSAPAPSVPLPEPSSSSPVTEEVVAQENKKSSTVVVPRVSSSGGGVHVPWTDIAQGFSTAATAAGAVATPLLQLQTAQLLAQRQAAYGYPITVQPVPVVKRTDPTWWIVGGVAVLGLIGLAVFVQRR